MGTDFFDHDLRADKRVPSAATDDGIEQTPDTISAHAISRLVVQKHDRSTQVAGAVQEIELLRQRQRELEMEKESLEALTLKQETYEREKRDVVEKLERSLVVFDKQAAEAMRAAELIAAVRKRFDESLQEIAQIDENAWPTTGFVGELNKALAVVEEVQSQYKKGMSKVSASSWFRASEVAAVSDGSRSEGGPAVPLRFGFWLKAGLAFSLPVIVVLLACLAVWLVTQGAQP
ncbi:MAG: hypothetical protein O3B24_09740 [Verrucomicrobia bacterium]|nr:hypothetical protein [Verrucomicrobiota bacterium]